MKKFKIFNEVEGFRVPRKKLEMVFGVFLKKEKVSGDFNVNLIFVRDPKMAELNHDYRGKEGTTDVLSFNYEDGLGEIYISIDEVRRNSDDLNGEVLALFAHGLLHLNGYTHETDDKMEKMLKRASDICKKSISLFVVLVLLITALMSFSGVAMAKKYDFKEYKVIEFIDGKLKFKFENFNKRVRRFRRSRQVDDDKPPTLNFPELFESNYPWHENITATTFWLGEEPSEDNGYISNVPTAWESPVANSVNPFYVALPYNDMEYVDGETRNKAEAVDIPWYDESLKDGYEFYSYIKNRWVMVTKDGLTAYGQVEDSGPHGEDLFDYVINGGAFSNPASSNNAGIDLSPAFADAIGSDGRDEVDWKFVEESEVPAGQWKEHIETQQCVWGQYGDVQ